MTELETKRSRHKGDWLSKMVLSSTMMWSIIQEDFTAIVHHDSYLIYVLSQLIPVTMHDRAVNVACSSRCRKHNHIYWRWIQPSVWDLRFSLLRVLTLWSSGMWRSCCLHPQGRRRFWGWKQQITPKHLNLSTRLHGMTHQNTIMLTFWFSESHLLLERFCFKGAKETVWPLSWNDSSCWYCATDWS